MDQKAQQAVNETIVAVCEFIQETIKTDLAADKDQLPNLIEALAILVRS
jgi:type II secretory pathway component PulC